MLILGLRLLSCWVFCLFVGFLFCFLFLFLCVCFLVCNFKTLSNGACSFLPSCLPPSLSLFCPFFAEYNLSIAGEQNWLPLLQMFELLKLSLHLAFCYNTVRQLFPHALLAWQTDTLFPQYHGVLQPSSALQYVTAFSAVAC